MKSLSTALGLLLGLVSGTTPIAKDKIQS